MELVDEPVTPILEILTGGATEEGDAVVISCSMPNNQGVRLMFSTVIAEHMILALQQSLALAQKIIRGHGDDEPRPATDIGDNLYEATEIKLRVAHDGQSVVLGWSGPSGPPVNILMRSDALGKLRQECKRAEDIARRFRIKRSH